VKGGYTRANLYEPAHDVELGAHIVKADKTCKQFEHIQRSLGLALIVRASTATIEMNHVAENGICLLHQVRTSKIRRERTMRYDDVL
jgi:hypothetical protein